MAVVAAQYNPVEDEKTCWVCFATEEDDREARWVKPCRCRGTNKWVHQTCLQRWVDEKQHGNSTAKVSCPQCNTEYLIVFPRLGPMVSIMDLADRITFKVCPFVAGGIFIGSMYWTAVTYGAVSVLQVLGHKEGLNVMEKADPIFLVIGLPTIPIMLILGKMIRWEDFFLKYWRKYSSKLPLISYLFGSDSKSYLRTPADTTPLSDPVSATRVLCGALITPTIATTVGKLLFSSVQSNFQRTLLGGIAFVAIKGIWRMYFKQQQYIRQAQRKILNFDENQAPTSTSTQTHNAAVQNVEPQPAPQPVQNVEPQPASQPVQNVEPQPVQNVEPQPAPEPVQNVDPQPAPEGHSNDGDVDSESAGDDDNEEHLQHTRTHNEDEDGNVDGDGDGNGDGDDTC